MTMDITAAKKEYQSEMNNLTEDSMVRILNFSHLNQFLRKEDLFSIIGSTKNSGIILKAVDMAISKFGPAAGKKAIDTVIIQQSPNPELAQTLLARKEEIR